mgnify:CR=1 FL=1
MTTTSLAKTARAALESLGYDNIHMRTGDGTLGVSKQVA